MPDLEPNDREFIKQAVRDEFSFPQRGYVIYVYEHISPSDPWLHECDVVLVGGPDDGERLYEVPIATPAPGFVTLPGDVDSNYVLSERPTDRSADGSDNEEGQAATERADEAKPTSEKPADVDDRPLCLVEYENGDPDAPVVTGWLGSAEDPTPVGRVNDVRYTRGDWVMELRTTENDEQYAQLGTTDQPGGPVTRGVVVPPTGDPQILGSGGTDLLAAAQPDTGDGDDGTTGAPGDGSGVLPDTDPTAPPADRAAQAGITINTTKTVTSMAEIDGAANTLYVVDGANGPLQHNGKHGLGTVDNVAICGINDARLEIPAGFRDYSVTTSGGSHFMWSGIDLDQTASGAHGRFNFNVTTAGFYEYFQSIGSGDVPNPDPTQPFDQHDAHPTLHVPARSANGTVRVKNVSLIFGGTNQDQHQGSSGFGIQFTPDSHLGTLNLVNTQFEEFSGPAVYGSACPGTINATGCRFYNNAVAQFRVANGSIVDSTVGYDFQNTGLNNADTDSHGVAGIASEQKKAGRGGSVDVKNCTIEWLNVAKTRGAVVTYDIHSAGTFGTIEGCEIVTDNVGGAAGIRIDGRCSAIIGSTFSGSESSGSAVVNNGPPIRVEGNTFNLAGGRTRISGPTR